MAMYMADRFLPGITLEQFRAIQRAEVEMSERYEAEGKPVCYVRSIVVRSESRCMCLFEAATAKLVQEVNEAAQLPFNRIIEVTELSPEHNVAE
jgi:hypothetical protein